MTGPPAPRLLFLRQSSEIERVKKIGRRRQSPAFALLTCTNGLPNTRVAVIVGRRFGTAVKRNRAKRIFRELARQTHRLAVGYDMLIFPRREALAVSPAQLRLTWDAALKQAGLMGAHIQEI